MANQTSDRQRMSNDLRELARLAKPGSGGPVHTFATAEGSGRVDLASLMTTDAEWADRELARANRARGSTVAIAANPWGAPPPFPRAPQRPLHALSPGTMAPVALEPFGEPIELDDEELMTRRSSFGRKAFHALLSLAAVGGVGFLAFTLAQHPPPAVEQATTALTAPAIAAAAPLPVAPTPQPTGTTATATTGTTATNAGATPATISINSLPTTTSKPEATAAAPVSRSVHRASSAPRVHVAATAPSPAPAARAAVVAPVSHAPSNDPLLDLIKKSVATGK
jgi:hypothetical protein